MHVCISRANLIYLDHTILFLNGLCVTTPSVISIKINYGKLEKLYKELFHRERYEVCNAVNYFLYQEDVDKSRLAMGTFNEDIPYC